MMQRTPPDDPPPGGTEPEAAAVVAAAPREMYWGGTEFSPVKPLLSPVTYPSCEPPTAAIAAEARDAAAATLPPEPEELDTFCDVSFWTECQCSTNTHRGGERKARYWHTLMGYVQGNGRPFRYWQLEASHTWRDGVRVPIGGQLVRIGSDGYALMCDESGCPREVTVQMAAHAGAADPVIRPCRYCYDELMAKGMQANVRLPASEAEPPLLRQLAEFHMATVYNAGNEIHYDDCVAIVKRDHPKWKRYQEQLALDTADMSLHALWARREYHEARLREVELAIDAAESVITNHVVS